MSHTGESLRALQCNFHQSVRARSNEGTFCNGARLAMAAVAVAAIDAAI